MAIASFIKWNLLFFVLFALAACSGGGDDDSSVVPRDAGSVEGYHIVEGDSDSSPLTLYFISPVDGLINYNTFNISAAAQSDYLPIEGTLQVEKDKEYAFYVTIYGDEKVEGTESFGINFIDTKGMSLGTVIGQIVNDDLPSVSSNFPEITETDIGTSVLSFEISLSEPVVDSYSLTVNTISFNDLSGPQKTQFPYVAMPDEDYERFDQIITFENGEINKTININVISENIVEEDEVVLLEFIDDEGTSVIQGRYAIGTIRSDETKDNNGFYLQYEGQPGLKNILEGTPSENEADTWKKINLPISIIEPDNIKQEQILVFNILNLTEAQNKGYISQTQSQSEQSALEESYISTTNNADICFNTPIELDTSDCEISTEYSLLTEDKSLQLEFYVRGDNFRELDETYIIALGNDQGVNFTNISGSIKNDDSERINIFYKGEYKDLIEFTNAGEIYEVNEPSGNTDSDVLIDFQIPSALQIKYDLEYSVSPYTGNGTAAEGNKDYDAQQSNVEGVLNFEKGIGLQTRQLALTLKGDGQYDGDKELKITFKNTSIEPLIIRIKDSDFPSVNIYKNQNADPIDNISQLDVFEPLESQSNQDEVKEYLFYLRMTGAYAALSDINYNIKITSDSSRSGDANECISIGRDSTISKPDFNDDFEIHYGNPLTQLDNAEGKLVIKKGSIQSKWALRIKQDPFIECIEEFKVSFTPVSQSGIVSDDKKAEITFKIIDTDKALITVESWEIAEADTGTKAQNFQFKANKKVNAVLTPNLMGQGLTCNADDLNPPIDAATTVSFTPDNLEPIFPIYIKGDTTVEPNEACKLEISRPEEVELAADLEALIEVQYLNSNGVVIEDATHATGMIVNDDKLNIGIVTTDVTEPAKDAPNVSVGTYSWDKKIAQNVGKIAIIATPTACTDPQNCVEESDTTLGLHNANPVVPQEMVIHKGDETAILLPSPSTDLPISIIGDDIVEEIETLNFSVARSAGAEYIEGISDTDVSINITSEDRLLVYLDEKSDDCVDNGSEQNCIKEFEVKYSATNTDGVLSDLDVALELSNANTLKLKQSSDDEDFYDATVSIKYGDGTYGEVYPSNGKIVVNLIDNKTDLLPVIKIEFREDSVVELDEKLILNLIKGTISDLYTISTETNKALIEQEVNNADFINLVVTGGREINEPASQSTPFTLTWLEDIDIESDADLPVLTYKIQATCVGGSTTECLSADSDYVLQKDNNGISLVESSILLKSASKEISMDYFQLLPADNLVELPELINFTLLNESSLIATISHDNDTPKTGDDLIGVIHPVSNIVTHLDWSLTVLSEEKLSLAAVSNLTEINEYCDSNDAACTAIKTVATIGVTGSVQVADNGPTIILDIANDCVISSNNSNNCALASEEQNANDSEKDYVFNHANDQLVLHTYNEAFSAASKNVQIEVSDDDWVEVTENIQLNLTPTSNTNNYIAKVNDLDWSYTQDITLLSEDEADINLIRDSASSTCEFATGTTDFTEDSSNNTVSCLSEYDLSTKNPIAKEVENLNVKLLRVGSTSEKFVFKQDPDSTVYDAKLSLDGTETYESSDIPVHTQGEITNKGDISTLQITYQPDSLVEVDETLHYSLEKVTNRTLYSINVNNNKINETILNNDYIDIEIIGNNTLQEPSAPLKPYSVTWNNQLELPDVNLPTLTFDLGACSGNSSLECMDTGDYTLGSSVLTLANGLTKSATIDYLTLKSDSDVELPEKINLSFASSESAYIRSIVHTNDASDNTDISATESADVFSLGWTLIVNSEDTLTVTLEDLESTLNESCDTNTNPTCAMVKTGTLKVGGTVASNGPTISLNVANTCSVDTNNTNHCAFEADDDSIKNSVHDYIFTSGKGNHVVHTYNTPYEWTDQDIEVTLLNDDWVEVPEFINLAYTVNNSSYIDTSPSNQKITINSEDTTLVEIARNNASTCEFNIGTTSFNEKDCNNLISQYDLSLTNPIAKEVPNIQVALNFINTSNNLVFQSTDAYVEGDDVKLTIDGTRQEPDGNKKLIVDVHTVNSTTSNGDFSEVKFTYYNDELNESIETLNFSFIKQDITNGLYSVPTDISQDALVYTESIIDDDSIAFSISESGITSVTEGATGSTSNIPYSFTWSEGITEEVGDLIFNLNNQGSAEEGVDFILTNISDSRLSYNEELRQLTFTNDVANTGLSISFDIQIQGDDLVEIDETINLSFAAANANTSERASLSSTISKTIPNDDKLIVTLFSNPDSEEGDGSVLSLTQPFSYTLNKNIAADVPTIELFMDLTKCDNTLVNCIEYNGADPLPSSNDIVFSNSQYLTLHTGPEGANAGVYTQSIDPETSLVIRKSVPLNHATDDRVEAHETLTVNFAKDGGVTGTNPEGRSFIQNLKNGDDIADTCTSGLGGDVPCEELDKSVVILNDDKIDLYITKDNTSCEITDEDVDPPQACQYTIDWKVAFDMQDLLDARINVITKNNLLDGLISNTDDQAVATNNTAINTPEESWFTWDVGTYVDLATKVKTNASTAKENAGRATGLSQILLAQAQSKLSSASTTNEQEAAESAVAAAESAIALLNKVNDTGESAINAANAALSALNKAKKASNFITNYRERAINSATAATNAANNAITQANAAIQLADDAVLLANAALQSVIVPVIDDDAGEISLVLTHSGAATYSETFKLDDSTVPPTVTTTIIDPKDYQVDFDGTVQTSKLILKEAGLSMAGLPRTLSITTADDNFMEPHETIDIDITGITSADNHEYISNSDALEFDSTIAENDTAIITIAAPIDSGSPVTSGAEGNAADTTIVYPVTFNPIAKNAPSISLRVTPTVPGGGGKIGSVMAADTNDYTVADLVIHTFDSSATLDETSLSLTIKPDNALELDELVQLNLSLNLGVLDTAGGIDQINYTIENDDAVIVNITSATSGLESVTSNTITYTLNNENIPKQNTERIIADNYPSIGIIHTTTGSAASGSDFIAPSDFDIHTIGSEKSNGDSVTQTLSIINDSVVEKDETVTLTFSDSTDVTFNVNGSVSNSLSYTISNNDYIQIEYRCSDTETRCNGTLGESGGNTQMKAVITAAYETQGISLVDRTFAFTQGEDAAENPATAPNDYSIHSVQLPEEATSGDLIAINAGLTAAVTIKDNDDIIEKTEHFNLVLPDNKYIQTTFTQTAFTITNDDFLRVNLEATEPTTDTANYNLNVCRPGGKTIEGGDIELTTKLSKVKDDNVVINDVTHLSCADIGLESSSSPECKDDTEGHIAELEKIIAAADILACKPEGEVPTTGTTLFTFKAHNSIQPNKWFNIEVTTDERCDTDVANGNCIDPTDVIVQNNQLTNVLDTGATKCLQGRDKRWADDCSTVDKVDYQKQDAAQTTGEKNVYPDLAYTFVNGTGLPVPKKTTTGEVCVQDNNTGFIWSGTVRDSSNGNKNIRAYTKVASLSEYQDYDCGMADDAGKSWQLPSVQELMTILDVEKLKMARELGIKFTNEGGEDVPGVPQFYFDEFSYNFANYWTSTNCDSGNGYFVLNFLNGELTCAANDEEHSIMMLYKQN